MENTMKTFTIEYLNTKHQSDVEPMTDIVAMGDAILSNGNIVTWTFIGYKKDEAKVMRWDMFTDNRIPLEKRQLIANAIEKQIWG